MSDPSTRSAPRSIPAERAAVGPGTKGAFAVALVLLAVLLVTSAQSPPPTEARIGQRVQLVHLIQQEETRARALQERVEELAAEIALLEQELADDSAEVAALREAVDELAAPAGLTPVRGPGVTVTLNDSTSAVPSGGDPNDYVIHEEDLQAVINALWAGGAEAVAVNGHRVVATTAIRCVGNVLLLHGATHSPPYGIEAIGDVDELQASLARDEAVARFARAVQDYKLGYDVALATDGPLTLPAYEGSLALQRAQPQEAARG